MEWNLQILQNPPRVFPAPAGVAVPEGVRAVCFEALPWRGKPTRVFAYYGVPDGATPERPAPGIILIHGAGGTAFADWVRLWRDRGYAAIAFDHNGGLPVGTYDAWSRNPDGGPVRGDIAQLTWPVADQWMFHAVADTLLAHSLLASLPGVDAGRIGATAISWGGVVLSIAAAVDSRLKFAAPVYGCGFLAGETDDGSQFVGQTGTPEQRAAWRALWDPANFLLHARIPMLWVNGTNDFAFTMDAWQRSYRAAPGPRALCLRVRMPHGHDGPGESPEEIHAFANSVLRGGEPPTRIIDQGRQGAWAWADFESPRPLRRAELHFTRDSGRWQERQWHTIPAHIAGGRITAELPPDTTTFFFNLIDDLNLIASSEHREGNP